MITIEQAIHSLIPNTEWHYKNGVLTVFTKNIDAPTTTQIEEERLRLEANQKDLIADKEKTKLAILDKLGLTADEAAVLLG